MVTVFEKTKRQRNLILIFVGVILITSLIIYFGYFKKEKALPTEIQIPEIVPPVLPKEREKIEIDFEVLKNPILERLQLFEKIEPAKPEEVGRENPFQPY